MDRWLGACPVRPAGGDGTPPPYWEPRRKRVNLVSTETRAVVWLYHGQWVANCPQGCRTAEKMGVCDDGTTGGLDRQRFYCRESHGGCGFTCAVDWPANERDIEELVLCRPDVTTRNWQPGEDIHDLLLENIEHGLVSADNGGH